jgi:hypothetical protein
VGDLYSFLTQVLQYFIDAVEETEILQSENLDKLERVPKI